MPGIVLSALYVLTPLFLQQPYERETSILPILQRRELKE